MGTRPRGKFTGRQTLKVADCFNDYLCREVDWYEAYVKKGSFIYAGSGNIKEPNH